MIPTNLDPHFLEFIVQSVPYGIFTVDQAGRITFFNQAAEQITGRKAEKAIGQPCHKVFQTELCNTQCPLQESVRTGLSVRDREVSIRTAQGEQRAVAVSTAALRDDSGRVIGGVEMFRDLRQVEVLRKRLNQQWKLGDIVSKNVKMQAILKQLPLLAQSPTTVLVEGASGTGKELIARAIHELSPRAKKPFVAVNCGALPDSLLESELFGYVRGAFTDARKDKPGRFQRANGGTIFLDEIGELSLSMQVKLLRVLQEREFEPLGASHSVRVDVRVVTATNKNLKELMWAGRFRDDLYYRLNVIRVELPPLAQRRDDIPLLVSHFIEQFNAVFGKHIRGLSGEAMASLLRAPFLGNVRELENAIEHAFVLCQGHEIRAEHLPSHLQDTPPGGMQPGPVTTRDFSYPPHGETQEPSDPLQQAEKTALVQALEASGNNRTQAAKRLGISRNTLWRKMKKLGIS